RRLCEAVADRATRTRTAQAVVCNVASGGGDEAVGRLRGGDYQDGDDDGPQDRSDSHLRDMHVSSVGTQGTNSSAPMSQLAPLGRGSPSMSVVGAPVQVAVSTHGELERRCRSRAKRGLALMLPPRSVPPLRSRMS